MTSEEHRFLQAARVGHLATVDRDGHPSVMPVCFQVTRGRIYTPIDEKPKGTGPRSLRRVRNLQLNPAAALVVDHWDEDWRRLGWVHVRGSAAVVEGGAPHRRGIDLLRAKYPQYRAMRLEERPMIVLTIAAVRSWGDLSLPW